MKKKLITTIAMLVGAVTLATAVFANYDNANGYTVYKNSLKSLITQENYTSNLSAKLYFDDELLMESSSVELFDKDGDVPLNSTQTNKDLMGSHEYSNSKYVQDNQVIYSSYQGGKDTKGWLVNGDTGNITHGMFGLIQTEDEDSKTVEKAIHFGELLGDLLVGDLKNNFVLTSKEDDKTNYSMHLETFQMPEIVQAGVSMMFSAMQDQMNSDSIDPSDPEAFFLKLSEEPKIQDANCYFTVDKDGRLLQNKLDGSLVGKDENGNTHTFRVEISIDMSDYGTTAPVRLDLSKEKNVRYSDKDKTQYTIDIDEATEVIIDEATQAIED